MCIRDSDYGLAHIQTSSITRIIIKVQQLKKKKHEKEFVQYLNRSNTALYEDILYFEGSKDGVMVEVAMQHNDAYTENSYGFVNNITTPEGGTHVMGFRNALTKTFNEYAKKNKLIKENDANLTGEDIREGLTAITQRRKG